METTRKILVLVLLTLIGIIIGFSNFEVPTANATEFKASKVAETVYDITREPHHVWDQEALARTRQILLEDITELGLSPQVLTYKDYADDTGRFKDIIEKFPEFKDDYPQAVEQLETTGKLVYDVNNIYFKIQGKKDTAIMLMGHYDSSPAKRINEECCSYGASDDGYAIGTMLEIARVMKDKAKKNELENSVVFLMTDAEELGLWGAFAATNTLPENYEKYDIEWTQEIKDHVDTVNNGRFDDVNFVINIEARGVKGPAVMFETSANNYKVMELFQHADSPFTYSLAADVYRSMPNGTDLSPFTNAGYAGINFAVLNNLNYYHTPLDNYENINLDAIQHYGDQILPIVEEYAYNTKYSEANAFDSNKGMIFFTLLPNLMINYSTVTNIILVIITILAAMPLLYFYFSKQENKGQTVKSFSLNLGIYFAYMFGFAVAGFIISNLLALINGIPFNIMSMPGVANAEIKLAIFITLAIFTLYFIRKLKTDNIYSVAIVFNILFLIMFMMVLEGGSFLFLWPLLLLVIYKYYELFIKSKLGKHQKVVSLTLLIIAALFIVILYTPIIFMFQYAITLGGLAVFLVFTFFAVSSLFPIYKKIYGLI